MKKVVLGIALVTMALLAGPSQAAEVRVFAAASLTDVLKELASIYEGKKGGKVVYNFGASNALARQIKEGAPADVFLSADEIQMDKLAEADLIDPATRADLLSNTLVIIVPADGPARLTPQQLPDAAVKRIALADTRSVPAGVYAREYLTKLGLWDAIESKVIPTDNVRAALAAVESGNVEAGMVYKTDAAISKRVKVAFEVPEAEGPKILFPGAVVRESENPTGGAAFLEFLKTDEAKVVFERFGFLVVTG